MKRSICKLSVFFLLVLNLLFVADASEQSCQYQAVYKATGAQLGFLSVKNQAGQPIKWTSEEELCLMTQKCEFKDSASWAVCRTTTRGCPSSFVECQKDYLVRPQTPANYRDKIGSYLANPPASSRLASQEGL